MNEKTGSDNIVTPTGKEKIGHHIHGSSGGFDGEYTMNTGDSSLTTPIVESTIVSYAKQGFPYPKRKNSAAHDDLKASISGVKNKGFMALEGNVLAQTAL